MSKKSRPDRRRAARTEQSRSSAPRCGPDFLNLLIIALLVVLALMVVVVALIVFRGGL